MEFGLATGLGLGLGLGLGRVSHGAGVMTAMLRHAMLCPGGGEVCVSGNIPLLEAPQGHELVFYVSAPPCPAPDPDQGEELRGLWLGFGYVTTISLS